MAKLLYQPHYDNGESYEDSYDWTSKTVYETEQQAIDEILSKGYEDLGEMNWDNDKLYTFDNAGVEYGQERYGFAYIDILTLGGTENDAN